MSTAEIPDTLVGVFEPDAEGGPTLIASRCTSCRTEHFPPKPSCPDCSSSAVESLVLPRTGTLHSWTTVRIPAPGIEAPFLLGEVDLPNGIRVVGRLEPDDYVIGQQVSLTEGIVRQDGDRSVAGYFFRRDT